MWCTHKGGLVIHRIGGLEINVLNESRTLEVIHRIGGLERWSTAEPLLYIVIHRIGGLEIFVLVIAINICSYTPHRWLRN